MSIAVSTTTDSGSTRDFTVPASQLAGASSMPSNYAGQGAGNGQLCTVHPDWCSPWQQPGHLMTAKINSERPRHQR
ncbi:hypothetical protein [Streptomyces sp. NPDC002671]